jgi:hypothetical protein
LRRPISTRGSSTGQQTEETPRHSALATRFDDDAVLGSIFVVTERHHCNVDPSPLEPTVRWTAEADRVGPRAPDVQG